MNFDSFLRKMGKQTNPDIDETRRPKPKSTPRVVVEEREPEPEEEDIIETEDPDEVFAREDRSRKEETTMLTEEEIVEKALDYARSVVKVVRQNFESEKERKIFFEAVRSAVTLCLGESVKPVPQVIVAPTPVPVAQSKGKKGKKEASVQQVEQQVSGYGLEGLDITESIRKAAQQAPINLEEVEDFNIKRKVGADGKVEADISGMTEEDIKAFKILSGMDQVNG